MLVGAGAHVKSNGEAGSVEGRDAAYGVMVTVDGLQLAMHRHAAQGLIACSTRWRCAQRRSLTDVGDGGRR